MGVFGKLFTALRGAATETGEAIVDTQALRILDQEMRDARTNLDEAKENLAKVIAEQMGVERSVKKLADRVKEYEGYAMQAMDKGDEKLATELADEVARAENELAAQQAVLDGYNNNINNLKNIIRNTERNIVSMEREISVIKTTESVQKASTAAATKFTGMNSSMRSATESLERIKQKQQQRSDQMNAAIQLQQEESGDGLQSKLAQAGIIPEKGTNSNAVLERLKAKRAGVSIPPTPPTQIMANSVEIKINQ
ncbi:phage shock protein A (IM30), suppresses sigma54-dependent transcription [Beggiatoa alba B18LD]|uniref:Phage shock protein A (IM30), suppresses sigma54-dependent transcription n=1 Tax=Beggiatoa alba B18LD TaxID=395493 RepID=I3CIR1_9GAMM|nr:PspA/IM30 family protein [Beggiatoa alba]EIJ43504.1 phage shock protein A (IM30), suppresses sigma54-dependent transcription [Beggiatoa alba B18LD]